MTTFKTLSARIRGATTELADLGEEEDEFTKTTSKLRDLVKSLTKFDIMESDGKTYKDIYDILVGIGKEWNNLTDVERASLGEALAGKRNANILYAVLQDTDLLESVYEKSLRSAGSAMREQENFQRSIQYSINQLKANGQALAQDFIETGTVKTFVNFLATIVGYLDQIIAKTGGLPSLIAAAFGAGSIGAAGGLQNIWNQIRQRDESGKRFIFSGKTYKSHIWQEGEALPEGVKVGDITRSVDKDLGFWGSTGGALVKNLAISAGVTLAVAAVTSIYKAVKEGEQAAKQAARNISDSKAEADGLIAEAKKLRTVLDDSSSTDSQKANAKSRLLDIQNKLIESYGNEAKQLDLINKNLDGQIERLEKLEKNNYLDWANEYQKGGVFGIGGRSNEQIGEKAYKKLQERASRTVAGGIQTVDLSSLVKNISGLAIDDVAGVQSVYTTMLTPEETSDAISALLDATNVYERNNVLTKDQVEELASFRAQLTSSLEKATSVIQDNTDAARMYAMVLLARSGKRTESGQGVYDYYEDVENQISDYKDALISGDVTPEMDQAIENTLSEVDALAKKFPELRAAFDFLTRSLTTDSLYRQRTATSAVEKRYGGRLQHLKDVGYSNYDAEHGLTNAFDQQDLENILAYYDKLGIKQDEAILLLQQAGWLTDEWASKVEETERSYGSVVQRLESLKSIISSIENDNSFAGLDAEQLALLENYEQKFLGLSQLRQKDARTYAEALKSIQHYENQVDIEEKRQSANRESNDVVYDRGGGENHEWDDEYVWVTAKLDTEEATKELTEWLDADAQYNIALTADIDLQADQIKEKLDAMGSAFDSIGDGWKVAKDNVADFVSVFPEAAAQAEVLKDGSLQLSQELVDAAYDTMNAEIDAAQGGALADIEAARTSLQAKIEAATAARDAAAAMASAISNQESISAEDRKGYEEAVTNAKKVCYDANQDNAIDAAGTESDASKDVADNSNDNSAAMAANASNSYTSMIGASADWAEAAIANANAVAAATEAAAEGKIVTGGVTRGSARNTYKGTAGVSNSKAAKKELKEAAVDLGEILADNADSAQFTAQAQGWDAYIENLTTGLANLNGSESKILGARDAYNKGFKNAGKDSGSGGGGGGGGSDKKDEAKEIDWMERMVTLLQKRHDLEKENADDEFRTYQQRIESTKELIRQDENLLNVYRQQSREYGVAYEKAYDEVRKLAENGQLKDLLDNDVYGLGASYEELKKVNDEINATFAKYGKGNLDYNNRPYIQAEDGSWMTMLTEGHTLKAGDNEFSMVITPILESGNEVNLDEYLAKIQAQIDEKAANGETISVDTILSLDKDSLIVAAAEGSWDANAAGFEQMEAELQVLKDRAIELRNANIDGVKSLRDAVENGSLDISKFSSEVQEAITDLIGKYDKVQESREQEKKTLREIKEHQQEQFELELNMIKERQKAIEQEADIIQHSIDMRETTGNDIIRESDYEDLIANADQLASNYYEQLEVLERQKASLDEGTAAWYNVVSQIYEVDSAIRDVEKQQAEWNETIKQLPIRRIQRYLQMLENIKKDIQNFNSEQSTLGVNPNQQSYTDMFNIGTQQITKYKEELDKLQANLKTYKYGTDKFEETANAIQECEDNVSSLIQEMREYNTAILNIPVDKINEVVEKLQAIQDAMQKVQDDNNTAIEAAITLLSDQIDKYNKEIDEINESYDERIKALQEEQDANQEAYNLEKARFALQKAMGQQTNKVLKNGEWVWEADIESVRDAANGLKDAQNAFDISELEKERDARIKPIQDEIDRLEKLNEKWSQLRTDRDNALTYDNATPIFGDQNWMEKVLSGNDDALWNKMDQSYEKYLRGIDEYSKTIEDYQQSTALMSTYIAEYNKAIAAANNIQDQTKREQAIRAASDMFAKQSALLSQDLQNGLTAEENLNRTLGAYNESSSASALNNSANIISTALGEFKTYFGVVADQNVVLSGYAQTWQDIHDSVLAQIEELKALKAQEDAALELRRQHLANSHRDSDRDARFQQNVWRVVGGGNVQVLNDSKEVGNGYYEKTYTSYDEMMRETGHHGGIKTGYIGHMNRDEQLRALDMMASAPLKKDDVPSLLQEGEVVLTQGQQANLLSHLVPLDESDMLSRFTLGPDVLNLNAFRTKKLKGGAIAGNGVQMQQNFNFGDIHVIEAQNVTDIAKGIMNGGLSQALTQQLYKR